MKKFTLFFTVLLLASLACSSVQIADPAFQQGGDGGSGSGPTPDALATVLAEVAQATKNAPPATPTTEADDTADEGADQEPTATPEEADGEEDKTATPRPDTGYPTAISLPEPEAHNFYTCSAECLADGSNSQDSFPSMIDTVYFTYDYEEFPLKAPYTRTWTKDGKLWAKYACLWAGDESGTDKITLTEPAGLASGEWNVVITVNGEEVLNETITIEGSYSFWSPPLYFNSCYGKK